MRPRLQLHDNRLVSLLAKLRRKEMTYFREFVQSPYFNKNEKAITLINILEANYPKFNHSISDKKTLFAQVFPKEKFSEQKLSDVLSLLMKLFEDFLAHNRLYDDKILKTDLRTREYLERQWLKSAKDAIHDLDQLIEKRSLNDSEQFYSRYSVERYRDQYHTSVEHRTKDMSLQTKMEQFDRFYLAIKLKDLCEMVNRRNIVKVDFNPTLTAEVQAMIQNHADLLSEPAIAIYYNVYLTLIEPETEKHFEQLMELIANHHAKFSEKEARLMYDYAQNYCIKKINSGRSNYAREIFNIYKQLIENKLIFENKVMNEWDYKNIVTIGTRLKEYKWTEKFITQYKNDLEEKTMKNAYLYNLASLYYARQDYDRAIETLRDVEFTDVYYGLGARSLLIKVYYEAEEFDPLYSLIGSFKIYLTRNKDVSTYQYTVHMNLLRAVKKLADIHLKSFSAKKDQLKKLHSGIKKKMDSDNRITNIDWVKEKWQELKTVVA